MAQTRLRNTDETRTPSKRRKPNSGKPTTLTELKAKQAELEESLAEKREDNLLMQEQLNAELRDELSKLEKVKKGLDKIISAKKEQHHSATEQSANGIETDEPVGRAEENGAETSYDSDGSVVQFLNDLPDFGVDDNNYYSFTGAYNKEQRNKEEQSGGVKVTS